MRKDAKKRRELLKKENGKVLKGRKQLLRKYLKNQFKKNIKNITTFEKKNRNFEKI